MSLGMSEGKKQREEKMEENPHNVTGGFRHGQNLKTKQQ